MKIIKTLPGLSGNYIRFFYSVKAPCYADTELIHRRLPDGTLDLVINLGSAVSISRDGTNFFKMPPALLTGLHANRSFLKYEGNVHLVGAVFEPGFAHLFVNDNLELYKSCNFDASIIYGNDVRILNEQLSEVSSEEQRHCLLEQFLMRYLNQRNCRNNFSKVPAIIKNIHSLCGNIQMAELYKNHFMSERNFRRKFQEEVGMSPKQYSTIIRIKAFSKYFEQERTGYSGIIDRLGYSDQPHFNKEFHRIAGTSPTEYFGQLNRMGTEFIHLI